jgi:PTH1 family peptidyl-tRNA hydrolase
MLTRFLVVGLGNPGAAYTSTPHNIGRDFLVFYSAGPNNNKWRFSKACGADLASQAINNTLITYALPRGFMNESGKPIEKTLKYLRLPLARCVIIHDDSDLPWGKIKIATASRAAGHHGIESIFAQLKTKHLNRIRVGVRQPSEFSQAGTFILKKFSAEQRSELKQIIYPKIKRALLNFFNQSTTLKPGNKK